MPLEITSRQSKISLRRPILSASGPSNKEPRAIPSKPELSNQPRDALESCHSAEMDGAAKAITSTSNPSIMLITIQTMIAMIWKRLIGP